MIQDIETYFRVHVWLSNNLHKLFNAPYEQFTYESWDVTDAGVTVFFEHDEPISFNAQQIAKAMTIEEPIASNAYLIDGAYIHSDDIQTEDMFNKLIERAIELGLRCDWTYDDFIRVTQDSPTRLVANLYNPEYPFIDMEGSPFPNRIRYTTKQWLGSN